MSYPTFQKLCAVLRPFLVRTSIRKPIGLQLGVALVLHRLGHNASVKSIAEEFGVGPSTVVEYTKGSNWYSK